MTRLGKPNPSVPVFVSSTFLDMQPYRRSVRDALVQLETTVRGMEQFGSKPGSPVDECLAVVRSCMVYVGIFGMRYGSIPDDYEKSMTHLEYEEAQKEELPSLIYLLDENQSIPAKDVETGEGANKLRNLKDHLKKRHVVSFFTTPEDLQGRILHDVPSLLKELGADVSDAVEPEPTDRDLLQQFERLPKLFRGRTLTVEFVSDGFQPCSARVCEALDLEIGATVRAYARVNETHGMYVHGEGDIALALVRLPKKTIVRARAVTAFGVVTEVEFTTDGAVGVKEPREGLIIKEIIHTKSPAPES